MIEETLELKQLSQICETLLDHDFVELGAEGDTTSESIKILADTYREAITEAWRIINVLNMFEIDRGEPYPLALTWLHEWEHLRPSQMKMY